MTKAKFCGLRALLQKLSQVEKPEHASLAQTVGAKLAFNPAQAGIDDNVSTGPAKL